MNVFNKELFRNASQCCMDISFGIKIAKIVSMVLHVIDVISCAIQMDIS